MTLNTSTLEAFNKAWPEVLINREEVKNSKEKGIFLPWYKLYKTALCEGMEELYHRRLKFYLFYKSYLAEDGEYVKKFKTLKQFFIEVNNDRSLPLNMEDDVDFLFDLHRLFCSTTA